MAVVYRIRDWDRHFEKSDTKKCQTTKWVPIPNKWDGKSYRRIMRMRDGAAIFGAWVLIVQVASRCPVRGVLEDDDGPLGPDDLADKTGCRAEIFRRALEILAAKDVGWIFKCDLSENAGNFRGSPETVGLQDRTGQDITELLSEACSKLPDGNFEPTFDPASPGDDANQSELNRRPGSKRGSQPAKCAARGTGAAECSPTIMAFPCAGKGPAEWPLTEAKLAEYRQSFPAVDALAECRKALQWCRDNGRKRKTFRGMPAFLTRWLSRVQDAGGSANGTAWNSSGAASGITREQQRYADFTDAARKFLQPAGVCLGAGGAGGAQAHGESG